jgi:hypothetical protein
MTTLSRPTFLQAVAALVSLPASANLAPARNHRFTARAQPDVDATPAFHGYPDECYAYAAFAASLVGLAHGDEWRQQPPIASSRCAIVVDFASSSEREAQASIKDSWSGVWELSMGAVSTLQQCEEFDAQNERSTRHLALIATGMSQGDFERRVTKELLDARTCATKHCEICAGRPDRDLADVLRILANGTEQNLIHLFSRWEPSDALRRRLQVADVRIERTPLGAIPAAELEANRRYHVWGGTPLQAREFLQSVWTPQWKLTGW